MAVPPRITALNLGTQTVGLAEFHRAENGGVMLNAFRLTEIHSDPSAEAARLPQTKLAISEMRDSLKLKGGPINYAVSGQNMFTRFVKLPPVAEDKVESIIGFEAQQNVPFPIEEVVWDYQLVSTGSPDSRWKSCSSPSRATCSKTSTPPRRPAVSARRSSTPRRWRSTTRFATTTATWRAARCSSTWARARPTSSSSSPPRCSPARSPSAATRSRAIWPRSSARASRRPRSARKARATFPWAARTPTTKTPTWPRRRRSSATR